MFDFFPINKHSNNIVISQIHPCAHREYIAKITDFGCATSMNEDNEDVVGQIPFVDPMVLGDPRHYKKNFKIRYL